MENIPNDIKPLWKEWFSIARRIQCEARKQQGIVAVKMIIFLNQDGQPVHWLEPITAKIEPKKNTNVREIEGALEILADWM